MALYKQGDKMEKQIMTDSEVIELIKLKDMQFHNLYLQVHDNKRQIKRLAKLTESMAEIIKEREE